MVRGEGKKRGIMSTAQRIFRAVKLFCDTVMVDRCHYTFVKIECTTLKVNPNVSYGLNSDVSILAHWF